MIQPRTLVMAVLPLLAASLPFTAQADVEPRFAGLRDQAEPLASVRTFIEDYVSDCAGADAKCERNAETNRAKTSGKKYYVIIPEDTSGVLSAGEINPRSGTVVINMTPFIAGPSSVLTHGAPAKTDANGNPVLPYLKITARIPDRWSPAVLGRQIASRGLRMQIVFTPQGLWTLPKKSGGKMRGIRARFDGILIQVGRTGEVIGTWYAPT